MNTYTTQTIGALSALGLLIVGGFYYFQKTALVSEVSEEVASSTPITIDANATTTVQDGYTIERVTEQVKPVAYPSLSRAVTPSASPEVTRAVNTAVDTLKKNPNLFEYWMQLGALRFALKDYEGAKEIWVFTAQNAVPGANENLGNLYANQLKDVSKAEMYYKKALVEDSKNPSYYRALAEFYQAAGMTAQAEVTLRAGIKAAPVAFDLQVLLARFVRTNGNILESNALYDTAAVAAEKVGNTALAQSIRDEKNQQ